MNSIYPSGMQEQVIYQADPSTMHSLKTIKDRMQQMMMPYMNRYVRIQTVDGQVVEGVIVSVDRGLIYLNVAASVGYQRQSAILPLVLYELLVITLLYT